MIYAVYKLWYLLPLLSLVALVVPKLRWMSFKSYVEYLAIPTVLGLLLIPIPEAYLLFSSPSNTVTTSETGVLVSAIAYNHGFGLYGDPTKPPLLGLLYGPWAFLPYSMVLGLWPIVWIPKAMGIIVTFLGILALWRGVAIRTTNWTFRVTAMILPWATSTAGIPLVYNPKGDPFVFLSCCLPWIFKGRNFMMASAACMAITADTKLAAAATFLPNLAVLWIDRASYKKLDFALAAGVFFVVLLAPFGLYGVPLSGYLHYLHLASEHRLYPGIAAPALAAATAWLIAAFAFWPLIKSSPRLRAFFFACVVANLLLCYPSMKVGAGAYHIATLFPAISILLAELFGAEGKFEQNPVFAPAAIFVILAQLMSDYADTVHGLPQCIDLARYQQSYYKEWKELATTLKQPFAIVPGAVVPEYGNNNYRMEDLMLPAALGGADVLVSPFTQGDLVESGLLPSKEVLETLASCKIKYMITRNGELPWLKNALYDISMGKTRAITDPYYSMYGWDMHNVFMQTYRPWHTWGKFQVWVCGSEPPEAAWTPPDTSKEDRS